MLGHACASPNRVTCDSAVLSSRAQTLRKIGQLPVISTPAGRKAGENLSNDPGYPIFNIPFRKVLQTKPRALPFLFSARWPASWESLPGPVAMKKHGCPHGATAQVCCRSECAPRMSVGSPKPRRQPPPCCWPPALFSLSGTASA
uniref:Uncharacterized protein n=1 Tax=Mustela putorius furo TaxID=9669 RepID=M3Y8A9_MUSPF